MRVLLVCSVFNAGQAAAPQQPLSSEFNGDAAPWVAWRDGSLNLNERPGFARFRVPARDFGGLELPGGVPADKYPPPWHFEIALERPTDENSAAGVLLGQGLQGLFHSLDNGTKNGFQSAVFDGGKGTPQPPNLSGVPANQMTGARLILYLGQVNDRTMRWGVRPNQASEWCFAPDVDLGFSTGAKPVSWPDLKVMVENRDEWFVQFGPGITGPREAITVDVDYIRFLPSLDPSPVSGESLRLVAHYQFDGDLQDSSGNQLPGMATGVIEYARGRFGQMAVFKDDAGITVKDSRLLNFGRGAFSVSMWVRMDNEEAEQNLLEKAGGTGSGYRFRTGDDGGVGLVVDDGARRPLTGPFREKLPRGEIHHLVFVRRLGPPVAGALYVNGVLKTQESHSEELNVDNSGDLRIGFAHQRPGQGPRLALDDLRLYNYELAEAEVAALQGSFLTDPEAPRQLQGLSDVLSEGSWATDDMLKFLQNCRRKYSRQRVEPYIAVWHFWRGNLQECEARLSRLEMHRELITLYESQGRWDKLKQIAQDQQKHPSMRVCALWALGRRADRSDQNSEAASYYLQALEHCPSEAPMAGLREEVWQTVRRRLDKSISRARYAASLNTWASRTQDQALLEAIVFELGKLRLLTTLPGSTEAKP